MINIPSFKQYLVEEEREIYFTFGRMNPPTVGHGKLITQLSTKAGRNPYKVFVSQSQDAKKNPLSYADKIKHVRKMFPKHARNVLLNRKVKSVFDAATNLYDQGYKKIVMVVGQDRVVEFETLLNKYNGVKGKHGFYNFERIRVVSAGQRDPDSEGVEGMSASKQREAARENDFVSFAQGLPKNLSNKDAKKLFNDVRIGMGLKEETQFKNHVELEPVSEIREKYIEGSLFEPGDRVVIKSSNEKGRIHRLGTNYVIISLDEGNISRQWIDGIVKEKTDRWYKDQPEWGTDASTKKAKKITPNEGVKQDPDIKDRKGTQPARYHSGLSKAQKISRDRQFKRQSKMSDSDPNAYKPAAGDKTTKTKPSKYTKSFKAMYGEDAVLRAKDKIDKEKKADKIKHDRMMDRARIQKARNINRTTVPEGQDKMNGVKFNPRDMMTHNPVAKNAHKFNKAAVHTDKKKATKRGYIKHKGKT